MTAHLERVLFIYSEAGKIYLDLIRQNQYEDRLEPVSIEVFRSNSKTYLSKASHLVVSGELAIIKEVIKGAIEHDLSLGIMPLPTQKTLRRNFGLEGTPDELLFLALEDNPSPIDVVFCNNEIVLFKGVIGRVPLFDSLSDTGKRGILWSGQHFQPG